MVLPPMRDKRLRSLSEATPVTSEPMTSGIAISLRLFRKIVPQGEIQSSVNSTQPAAAATMP